MSGALVIWLALAGGAGAVTRAAIDELVHRCVSRDAPVGILIVNVSASFVLGLVATVVADSTAGFVLSAGFLGAYSTFSTVSVDTLTLLRKRHFGKALMNSVGMLALGVLAIIAGLSVGSAL